MKKCPKCGRTSPPALAVCPRCKTPFNASATGMSTGSVRNEEDSGGPSRARTVATSSLLIVLVIVLAVVLYMNWDRLTGVSSQSPGRTASLEQKILGSAASSTPTVPVPPDGSARSAGPAPGMSSMDDEETRAAREAYKRCAEAIRSGDMTLAKTFISRAALEEMEQSGHIDMALGMITGMNIDEFQTSRQGDRITFKQSQKQGDATMSVSLKMVKEDGQWKLGN